MIIKFWGTRGSIPVPGHSTLIYGGNTSCIEIKGIENRTIIFDAGSGIRELGNEIIKNSPIPHKIDIFISHSHWDHIHGLPFFAPFYRKGFDIELHFFAMNSMNISDILDEQMKEIFFPVTKDVFSANLHFTNIKPGESIKIGNFSIDSILVYHTVNTLSFKITEDDKTFVYMTDNEIKNLENDIEKENLNLINFCHNVDFLVHDSMYSKEDYKIRHGWGHSDIESLAYFSDFAKVKNLILFHHNPDYDDETIEILYQKINLSLKLLNSKVNCFIAKEGFEIDL